MSLGSLVPEGRGLVREAKGSGATGPALPSGFPAPTASVAASLRSSLVEPRSFIICP